MTSKQSDSRFSTLVRGAALVVVLGAWAAFFWSLKPADAEAVRAAGLAAWKDRVAALWPACRAYLDQIESFDQLALARYGHHTLSQPIGRRLAVIGDAAHSTSPQLGQGANMALLDAAALAHALAATTEVETALATLWRDVTYLGNFAVENETQVSEVAA